MSRNHKNLFASIVTILILMVILPTFFLELFPFSVYPMLSDSWQGYSQVVGKGPQAKKFLKENRVNSNYFGIPQDLPVGRAYEQTLLLFGKHYTTQEVKALMGLLPVEEKLCFVLINYGQSKKGEFQALSQEDFCLDSTR